MHRDKETWRSGLDPVERKCEGENPLRRFTAVTRTRTRPGPVRGDRRQHEH